MSKLKYVHTDTKYVENMEKGLDEYLSLLWRTVDEEDYSEDFTLTGNVFCGCETCVIRETVAYLLPFIIEGYDLGKFELNEEYQP